MIIQSHISAYYVSIPRYRQSQYVTSYDDVISQLNVSHVTDRDGGHYSCLAENKAGSITHTAEMRVFGNQFLRIVPNVS
jgi:Immunoglobulin I-set domain